MSSPAHLAHRLSEAGFLTPDWRDSFQQVRREQFLPARVWIRGDCGWLPVNQAEDPARWHSLAYEDKALVTKVEDDTGADIALVPLSSASMPRIVSLMLAELDVHDGMKVLEVGTGTGYNAALLAHRLGSDHITTIEVDSGTAAHAHTALKNAGYAPTVITGDGAYGWPPGAPYNRIIATCAVHHVPHTWAEQTAPGGLIVLPWGTGLYNGVLLRLTVTHSPAGPTASGPVVGDSSFMWMRAQTPHRDVMAAVHDQNNATTTTALDPRCALGDDDAAFTIGVKVPHCRSTVGHGPDGEWTLWLADAAGGSWASVDYVPHAAEFEVQQYGPRRLWTEIEDAYQWWRAAGSPTRTRYGLTVTPAGQHVWLNSPDSRVR